MFGFGFHNKHLLSSAIKKKKSMAELYKIYALRVNNLFFFQNLEIFFSTLRAVMLSIRSINEGVSLRFLFFDCKISLL